MYNVVSMMFDYKLNYIVSNIFHTLIYIKFQIKTILEIGINDIFKYTDYKTQVFTFKNMPQKN